METHFTIPARGPILERLGIHPHPPDTVSRRVDGIVWHPEHGPFFATMVNQDQVELINFADGMSFAPRTDTDSPPILQICKNDGEWNNMPFPPAVRNQQIRFEEGSPGYKQLENLVS
ncbi:hypothetical protein GF362_03920 [Candidatus Dojkabacteria bacterium]|nr:hypothetical protein [Candidatus Dojkabacteria bacterium]